MVFTFDSEYNDRLYEARHIGFETALEAIAAGQVISDYPRADRNSPTKRVLIITLGDSTCYLPYLVVGKKWLFQTLYPETQLNRKLAGTERTVPQPVYLNEEEKDIITAARTSKPSTPQKPDASTLSSIRKAAAKALKRERKKRIRISADGPPNTKEHFGEIAGRVGKTGRW